MNLHIESEGEGRDIVLIHGWGMHGGCWDPVVGSLSEKFRVHRVDLPGHGSSGYEACDWVDALAERFPFEVMLCGWSLGGQLAIEWARRRPGLVARLSLVSTTPRFVAGEDWIQGIAREVFTEFSSGLEKDPEGTLKSFLYLQARGGEDERALFRRLQKSLSGGKQAGTQGLRDGLELLFRSDLRNAARSVAQSTLILHGECDRLTPLGAGIWLSENMPGAKLMPIPGCAHAPFFSCPDLFASKLTEFFDES